MPIDKHDFKSVEWLSGLEESQVIPLIPKLLEWLQDVNWPIATAVADLLQKYKVHTLPHIEAVFLLRNDSIWIYNILAYLMNEWDSRLVSALSASILTLAQAADIYEDTDLLAVEMLCKHRLITQNAAVILLETKLSDDETFAQKWELENLPRRQEEIAATLNRLLA